MTNTFHSSDIEKITGVKRTRLQQWLEKCFIKPSIQIASGYGTRNLYSIEDVYKIAAFKQITESGIQRKTASEIVNKIDSRNDFLIHLIINESIRISFCSKAVKAAVNKNIEGFIK